jgi:hypothetical protein
MTESAKKNKFNSLEQVRNYFRLVDQPFEIGTVLTPTLKLKRAAAKEIYKNLIDDIY